MARPARLLRLALLLALPAAGQALNLEGDGTITPQEQQALEVFINYFGRASIFVREYCYFDAEGNPKNKGTCRTEVPRLPAHSSFGGREAEYARQFYGRPMGEVVADPRMELIYLRSFPDVWMACNNPKAFGCTYTREWPDKVTVFVTTYDKKLGDITLTHEIEYHVKRDIKH